MPRLLFLSRLCYVLAATNVSPIFSYIGGKSALPPPDVGVGFFVDGARLEQFCSDFIRSSAYDATSLKPEERPMRINWEVVKPSLWTGAGGVVVGMLLLSYGFGFMSRTTAEKLASTSSERAVIAVLAPVCADKFRALPDVAARTATLVANKDSSLGNA